MRRAELVSRFLIVVGIALAIVVPILFWSGTPLIHVSMAEAGGWSPDTLRAEVGKPLELHLTSDDVVHGFAVGQMCGTGGNREGTEPYGGQRVVQGQID